MNLVDQLDFSNPVHVELWRDGKCIAVRDCFNGVTNEGKNGIMNTFFNGSAQSTAWYIGLIDLAGYDTLSSSDVMANHTGWLEWDDYVGTTRLVWGQGTAAGQQIANGTVLEVEMTASGQLNGIFITTGSAKNGTSGVLWATALFTVPLPCDSGDTLKLTYAIQL